MVVLQTFRSELKRPAILLEDKQTSSTPLHPQKVAQRPINANTLRYCLSALSHALRSRRQIGPRGFSPRSLVSRKCGHGHPFADSASAKTTTETKGGYIPGVYLD
eukprot:6046556-Amphidinium_carterae.1